MEWNGRFLSALLLLAVLCLSPSKTPRQINRTHALGRAVVGIHPTDCPVVHTYVPRKSNPARPPTAPHGLERHGAVQVDKDEDLRFALLVEAFGDADSSGVALVTDLIVFFNTILSSAFEFEERVMLRTEMIAAGILEAMQRIRDYFNLSKVGA